MFRSKIIPHGEVESIYKKLDPHSYFEIVALASNGSQLSLWQSYRAIYTTLSWLPDNYETAVTSVRGHACYELEMSDS